jgi:hypothetical protein
VTRVIHAFDGTLELRRPLYELATVFEMTGLGVEVVQGGLRSNETGLRVEATSTAAEEMTLLGDVDDARLDPEAVLRRLALAMEADGIRFTLRLLDADGVARVTYESDR